MAFMVSIFRSFFRAFCPDADLLAVCLKIRKRVTDALSAEATTKRPFGKARQDAPMARRGGLPKRNLVVFQQKSESSQRKDSTPEETEFLWLWKRTSLFLSPRLGNASPICLPSGAGGRRTGGTENKPKLTYG
jgi:hypothetical protein